MTDRYLWKDEASSNASCCPALYKVEGGFVVQGKQYRDANENLIRDLGQDEGLVYVPDNVIRRLFNEEMDATEAIHRLKEPYMSKWAEYAVTLSNLLEGDRVLDFGCGTGFIVRVAEEVVGPGGSVVGVDIDPISTLYASISTNSDIRWSSRGSLTLKSDSFDKAICHQAVQYMSDPVGSFREIRRLLKPEGVLVVSVWDDLVNNEFLNAQAQLIEDFFGQDAGKAARSITVSHLGPRSGLRNMVLEAGFEVSEEATHSMDILLPAGYIRQLIESPATISAFAHSTPGDRARAMRCLESTLSHVGGNPVAKMTSVSIVATPT